MTRSKNKGFTLIELMVVVALVALLLVGVSNLFLATIRGGGRADVLAKVKDDGDYAMVTMERLIRNGNDVDCSANPVDRITIKYISEPDLVLSREDASGKGYFAKDGVRLTSEEVDVTTGTPFNCIDNNDGFKADVVTIRFHLNMGGLAGEDFETMVTQRNTSN